jgi:hypothetical protein
MNNVSAANVHLLLATEALPTQGAFGTAACLLRGRSISSEPRHPRHDTIIFALFSPSVSRLARQRFAKVIKIEQFSEMGQAYFQIAQS